MKILSVSTATNNLSVALNDNKQIIIERNESGRPNYNERLDPLIVEILKEKAIELKEIERFAVAIGPGSYTGLRIGLTTVKMLASILNKEVCGVSTLKALAINVPVGDSLLVTGIDARNDNFFAGAYAWQNGYLKSIIPDGHYHINTLLEAVQKIQDEFSTVKFLGSGFDKQSVLIKQANISYTWGTPKQNVVHAGSIGQLAVDAQPVDPDELLPKYLRRTQAEVDWHKRTGRPYEDDSHYVEEV